MSRTTPPLIVLLVALAAGSGATAQARPLPAGALRVKPVEIIDRHGFEKPLVAATMLVPLGWKGEGGVEWNPMDPCDGEGCWVRLESPPRPTVSGPSRSCPPSAGHTATSPCRKTTVFSSTASGVRAYLEWFVQRSRPGARVLDFRARPDLAAPYQQLAQLPATPGMRTWVEGGELLIGYQVGGRPVREAIATVTAFIHTRMQGLGAGQDIELLQGQAFTGFAMRAPEGQLDFKMADALRQSFHGAPEWNARIRRSADERHRVVMESNRRIAEDNLRGARERSEIIARTGQEINDIQMGTWRSQNESSDRTQRERVEAIRGVETYKTRRERGRCSSPASTSTPGASATGATCSPTTSTSIRDAGHRASRVNGSSAPSEVPHVPSRRFPPRPCWPACC